MHHMEDLYFKADFIKPDYEGRKDIEDSHYTFYGYVPSLYRGNHVGWEIAGVKFKREEVKEYYFEGQFTGGHPVGIELVNII